MEESRFLRFKGNLDPRAQEFRPTKPINHQTHNHLIIPVVTQLPIYYPFNPPPPPPPPPPPLLLYHHQLPPPILDYNFPVVLPFCNSPPFDPPTMSCPLPIPSNIPTRSIVLSSVPSDVSESRIRRELEVFGEVRGVQMETIFEGIVTVHFHDLRHAEFAFTEIRQLHMQNHNSCTFPPRWCILGPAVWAHFVLPSKTAVPDGYNQGTVVIFNLDPAVTAASLVRIFGAYGEVKEVRETPLKKHQRFIEYYDIRDAAKAIARLNGKPINGKQVVLEFSRPGRKFIDATTVTLNNSPVLRPAPPPEAPPVRHRNSLEQKCRNDWKISNGNSNVVDKLSSKKHGKTSASTASTSRARRKGKRDRKAKADIHFRISEDEIEGNRIEDSRTTVMIQNIPNKYSQKLLLSMLDNHCIGCNEKREEDVEVLSSYDFVYLPIDFNNKCNMGYGFVNMTSPEAARRLYKAFHHQNWEVFNSRKICVVSYARVQGLEALKEHFRESKFPCSEMEHYLPVSFSPPRDGRNMSKPLPVAGHHHGDGDNLDCEDLDDDDGYGDNEESACCSSLGSLMLD